MEGVRGRKADGGTLVCSDAESRRYGAGVYSAVHVQVVYCTRLPVGCVHAACLGFKGR